MFFLSFPKIIGTVDLIKLITLENKNNLICHQLIIVHEKYTNVWKIIKIKPGLNKLIVHHSVIYTCLQFGHTK